MRLNTAALVMMALPYMVSVLLLAIPCPQVNAPPSRFQVVLSKTVTVLFEEPLPMVKPAVHMVALVAVNVLKPPPIALAPRPTVTKPLLLKIVLGAGPLPPLITNALLTPA